MDCETGKKQHDKETAATEVVGRYSRSLKGVARHNRNIEKKWIDFGR